MTRPFVPHTSYAVLHTKASLAAVSYGESKHCNRTSARCAQCISAQCFFQCDICERSNEEIQVHSDCCGFRCVHHLNARLEATIPLEHARSVCGKRKTTVPYQVKMIASTIMQIKIRNARILCDKPLMRLFRDENSF